MSNLTTKINLFAGSIDSLAMPSSPTLSGGVANGPTRACEQDCEGPSDEVLVARVCAGSSEALAVLFARYARIAYGIAQRILRDHGEAEDLVQDAFLYIFRKSHVFNAAKGSASSWIVQTIYYQALQRRMRLAARHQPLSGFEKIERERMGPATTMEYDRSMEGLLGKVRLHAMMNSLTEDQWETLRLHFFEGYTLSEIAEKRQQSRGNVRHHFYRGLEKLRSDVFGSELQDRTTSGTK